MMPDKIRLHPEFTGSSADVTLVAGAVGFRVNRAMLGMASPTFAKLVRASDLSGGIVDTGDEAGELYAFLKLMRIGPSHTAPPPAAAGASLDAKPVPLEEKENRQPDILSDSSGRDGGDEATLDEVFTTATAGSESDTKETEMKETHSKDLLEPKGPLSESTTQNSAAPIRPKILVSRPGTGVKALDRALRDAQAKAEKAREKKSRVRFSDQSPPVPPPLPLPPSHPFRSSLASPAKPRPESQPPPSRSRSNSAASQPPPYPPPTHSPPLPPRSGTPRSTTLSGPLPPPLPKGPVPPKPATPSKNPARFQNSPPAAKHPPPPKPPAEVSAPSPVQPPPAFTPSISQLLQIHRLTQKYPGFYTQAILDFHIELNSPSLVASLGPNPTQLELFRLLELAHALKSSKLWSLVLSKLAHEEHWRRMLDPWSFGELEARALGSDVFSILGILGAIHMDPALARASQGHGKGRKGNEDNGRTAFSQVDKVVIMYDEEGQVSISISEGRCDCGMWAPS